MPATVATSAELDALAARVTDLEGSAPPDPPTPPDLSAIIAQLADHEARLLSLEGVEPPPPPPPPPPGDIPPVGSDVTITTARSVTGDWDVASVHIEAGGTLEFLPNVTAKIKVRWLDVKAGGTLRAKPADATVKHTIEIANATGNGLRATGTLDFEGTYKDSFCRLAQELAVGGTLLTFETPPVGWLVGDKLVIPDSKQWARAGGPYVTSLETATIASISGATVTLTAPLQFAHPGARDGDDVLEFLPHVANLTRNVKVKSESASGERGYVLFRDRADISCKNTEFAGLGQTSLGALGPSPTDRYPVTFLDLYGPSGGQPNGYGFTFTGNSVHCQMSGHPFKGPALSNSHYGLIQGNVFHNWAAWSLATKTGNESFNMIDGNMAVGGRGHGDREGSGFPGDESAGFWFAGPNNIVCNNVVTTCMNPSGFAGYGFKVYSPNLGILQIPTALGCPSFVGIDGNDMPLQAWDGNECYALEDGVQFWGVNTHSNTPGTGGESFVRNTRLWHVTHFGYFGYPTADVTFDGWVQRGYKPYLQYEHEGSLGMWNGDYMAHHFRVKNADIQCLRIGISDPTFGGSDHLLENCHFRCAQDIYWSTIRAPGSGGGGINRQPRSVTIRNCTHGSTAGWNLGSTPRSHIFLQTLTDPNESSNLIVSDIINVENYNGTGIDYRVYFNEQAADWVLPQTTGNLVGSPFAGLTNQQNWDQHGIARAGAVAPADAVQFPAIFGLTKQTSQ